MEEGLDGLQSETHLHQWSYDEATAQRQRRNPTEDTSNNISNIIARYCQSFLVIVESSHICNLQSIGNEKFEHEPSIWGPLGEDMKTTEDIIILIIVNFGQDCRLVPQKRVS